VDFPICTEQQAKKQGTTLLLPKIAFNRMLESNKVHACFKSRRSFTRKSGQEFAKEMALSPPDTIHTKD